MTLSRRNFTANSSKPLEGVSHIHQYDMSKHTRHIKFKLLKAYLLCQKVGPPICWFYWLLPDGAGVRWNIRWFHTESPWSMKLANLRLNTGTVWEKLIKPT